MNTNFHTESRMREICTYGSMRGRAYPTRGVPLYSTGVDIVINGRTERAPRAANRRGRARCRWYVVESECKPDSFVPAEKNLAFLRDRISHV